MPVIPANPTIPTPTPLQTPQTGSNVYSPPLQPTAAPRVPTTPPPLQPPLQPPLAAQYQQQTPKGGKGKKILVFVAGFIGILAIAYATQYAWNLYSQDKDVSEYEPQISAVQNVQVSDYTPNSVTIAWTSEDMLPGAVWYGEDESMENYAEELEYVDQEHSVTILGLTPASIYYFKIEGDTVTNQFETPDSTELSADDAPTPPETPTVPEPPSEPGLTISVPQENAVVSLPAEFSGYGEAGESLTIIIDPEGIEGSSTIDQTGFWSYTLPVTDLTLGDHILTVISDSGFTSSIFSIEETAVGGNGVETPEVPEGEPEPEVEEPEIETVTEPIAVASPSAIPSVGTTTPTLLLMFVALVLVSIGGMGLYLLVPSS